MSKIIYSLRNIKDRIRANLTIKTQNILFYVALFLIVFLSIFVRASTITSGTNLIKAFDPWIQYYNAEFLNNHSLFEYFNWHDFKSWYPDGYRRANLRPGLTFTVVIIYKALTFLGIPVSLYNICFYFPAFMGGMTVLAMYFLGTELLDRRCGLLAAFFLAFSPGHMGRTVAGFFDNETIGVFATLMTFFFFLKAMRTGKISFSVLAGLFSGYLGLSWGGFRFVFLIIPIVVLILILIKKYNGKVFIAFIGTEGVGLIITALEFNYNYSEIFSSIEVGGIVLAMVLLTFFHLIYTKRFEYPKFFNGLINSIKWGIIPGFLIVAVIIWAFPDLIPFGFGSRFQSILSPLIRDQLHLVASVAEHMPSSWSVYYNNILIPMMLIPLGVYFAFKRLESPEIFLLLFLFTLFYFTGSMIRIILLFAPAAALMGAYGLAHVLKIYGSFYGEEKSAVRRKRKRQLRGKQTVGNTEVLAVYFIISILCIVQVVHAGNTAVTQLRTSQLSPGDQIHDWEESLTWMKTNLEGTSVVVSWWDYGYWLTPIGNVTTVNDNNTHNGTRIGLTGMGFMQTNELYSAEIFRKLKADYVLVYFGFWTGLGGDEGKWPWMVRICNDHYEKYKTMGLEKDNWAEDSVFKESNYVNTSAGSTVYRKDWFDSQLVRLMFYGEPTNPQAAPEGSLSRNFANRVNSEKDDAGNLWVTHIPTNSLYDFKVFEPVYISRNHLVKLYKVDYTALDSSFNINEPNINTEGYGTFKIHNTGEKDIQISDVLVNGISHEFTMGVGASSQILEENEEKMVWIDTGLEDSQFEENDVVNITVEAQTEGVGGKQISFTNSTRSFFVKEGASGDIKINRENSVVFYNESSNFLEANLEVENTGQSTVLLNNIYTNNQSNNFAANETNFISGTPVLESGTKALVHLTNISRNFNVSTNYYSLGVSTARGYRDETIFSENYQNYKLSIIDQQRIISSELSLTTDSLLRDQIPTDLTKNYASVNSDGSAKLQFTIKNTGNKMFGLDTPNLFHKDSMEAVDNEKYDWRTTDEDYLLSPGEEKTVIIESLEDNIFEIDEEIIIYMTGSDFEGEIKATDLGFIHTIKSKSDFNIIENVQNSSVSHILADETGQILIKNTGNEAITLDTNTLNLNGTEVSNIRFEGGDASLGLQEAALISFDIPNLKINKSNSILLDVNATDPLKAQINNYEFTAKVNLPESPNKYNIELVNGDTGLITEDATQKLNIELENTGTEALNIDSVYINGTYIDISNFEQTDFSLAAGETGSFTIAESDLDDLIGFSLGSGDKIKILARTEEGAEDEEIDTV